MITQISPETIENKKTGDGNRYLYIVADDGTIYTCWIEELFDRFKIGNTTKAEVQPRGKFINIVGIPGVKVKNPPARRNEAPRGDRGGSQGGNRGGSKGGNDADRARGQATGLCFGKACDIVIALYQKNGVKKQDIFKETEKTFGKLMDILEKNDPALRRRG